MHVLLIGNLTYISYLYTYVYIIYTYIHGTLQGWEYMYYALRYIIVMHVCNVGDVRFPINSNYMLYKK